MKSVPFLRTCSINSQAFSPMAPIVVKAKGISLASILSIIRIYIDKLLLQYQDTSFPGSVSFPREFVHLLAEISGGEEFHDKIFCFEVFSLVDHVLNVVQKDPSCLGDALLFFSNLCCESALVSSIYQQIIHYLDDWFHKLKETIEGHSRNDLVRSWAHLVYLLSLHTYPKDPMLCALYDHMKWCYDHGSKREWFLEFCERCVSSPPTKITPQTLFIYGIGHKTEYLLRDIFSHYGSIVNIHIPACKNFGFITFASPESVYDIILSKERLMIQIESSLTHLAVANSLNRDIYALESWLSTSSKVENIQAVLEVKEIINQNKSLLKELKKYENILHKGIKLDKTQYQRLREIKSYCDQDSSDIDEEKVDYDESDLDDLSITVKMTVDEFQPSKNEFIIKNGSSSKITQEHIIASTTPPPEESLSAKDDIHKSSRKESSPRLLDQELPISSIIPSNTNSIVQYSIFETHDSKIYDQKEVLSVHEDVLSSVKSMGEKKSMTGEKDGIEQHSTSQKESSIPEIEQQQAKDTVEIQSIELTKETIETEKKDEQRSPSSSKNLFEVQKEVESGRKLEEEIAISEEKSSEKENLIPQSIPSGKDISKSYVELTGHIPSQYKEKGQILLDSKSIHSDIALRSISEDSKSTSKPISTEDKKSRSDPILPIPPDSLKPDYIKPNRRESAMQRIIDQLSASLRTQEGECQRLREENGKYSKKLDEIGAHPLSETVEMLQRERDELLQRIRQISMHLTDYKGVVASLKHENKSLRTSLQKISGENVKLRESAVLLRRQRDDLYKLEEMKEETLAMFDSESGEIEEKVV
ncbi:hypothetical protein ADUPG1_008782 [Aduncisulcus paluster]|uniref:RRM domain-containing protein n=1 Tax=Aduncisulcus paluster TaxID=2918883 RepID=A0ABQ5KUE3_9EUKA|nr:hypothetical protein ADUPG1_008782 [Aduncisulcus paluster]